MGKLEEGGRGGIQKIYKDKFYERYNHLNIEETIKYKKNGENSKINNIFILYVFPRGAFIKLLYEKNQKIVKNMQKLKICI